MGGTGGAPRSAGGAQSKGVKRAQRAADAPTPSALTPGNSVRFARLLRRPQDRNAGAAPDHQLCLLQDGSGRSFPGCALSGVAGASAKHQAGRVRGPAAGSCCLPFCGPGACLRPLAAWGLPWLAPAGAARRGRPPLPIWCGGADTAAAAHQGWRVTPRAPCAARCTARSPCAHAPGTHLRPPPRGRWPCGRLARAAGASPRRCSAQTAARRCARVSFCCAAGVPVCCCKMNATRSEAASGSAGVCCMPFASSSWFSLPRALPAACISAHARVANTQHTPSPPPHTRRRRCAAPPHGRAVAAPRRARARLGRARRHQGVLGGGPTACCLASAAAECSSAAAAGINTD